MRPLGGVRARK